MTDEQIPHPAETPEPPRGFAPAVRERHHARIAVEGPKGAGKSRLALQWASVLAGADGNIAAIDTEHRRLAAYAPAPFQEAEPDPASPPWKFWHHAWSGTFDPVVLVRRSEMAAEAVGPNGVVIIDSLTPFWSGRGGIQDIVDASPSGWKVGAPVHREMLDALSRLPCHLIVTMRSKTEYVIEEKDMGGRLVHAVRRIGGAPDQRLGIDFEFEMIVTLDADHQISVTASACPPEFTLSGVAPSYSVNIAQAYATWIEGGIERIARSDLNAILAQFDLVDEKDERASMKSEFVTLFGAPDDLMAEEAPAALDWVQTRVAAWLAPPEVRPTIAETPAPPPEQPPLPEAPPEEPVEDTGDGLAGKPKSELVAIAKTMGVEIDGRWGAARIAEALRLDMAHAAAEEMQDA